MLIIKSSPQGKEAVLEYIGNAISRNIKRGRTVVDFAEVGTDAFFINLQRVCLKLTEPIIDVTRLFILKRNYSKLHLIDLDYFKYTSRFSVEDDTKICCDADAYSKYVQNWKSMNPDPKTPNFISDVFYLTLSAPHYGLMSCIRYSLSHII